MSTFELLVNDYKKRVLTDALKRNLWNQCAAARDLGIHRNTMERYIVNLGIANPRLGKKFEPNPGRIGAICLDKAIGQVS